jgi:hypothetical protein
VLILIKYNNGIDDKEKSILWLLGESCPLASVPEQNRIKKRKQNKMKTPKQYKRYIPELAKIKLSELSYKRKDNLYVIIDLIYRRNVFFKSEEQKQYGYSPIPKTAFNELLGKAKNVLEDIDFLIELGVIRKNDYYNYNEGICKSYKISSEFLSKKVPVIIESKSINSRIKKEFERMKRARVKNLDFQKSKYYKTFKIDYEPALAYLETKAFNEIKKLCLELNHPISRFDILNLLQCKGNYGQIKIGIIKKGGFKELDNILHRYMVYTSQVNCINDGYLYFKRNGTNNRLDTNLTSLPKFLRQFIKSEQELYSIDVKNSQPFFLFCLLSSDPSIEKNELNQYRDLVISSNNDNGLYEFLIEKYYSEYKRTVTRPKMKIILFKIFYSENKIFRAYKGFFEKCFPTIYKWIEANKINNHKEFASLLQGIESDCILDKIMPKLLEKNIIPYTIHDSFVCHENEVQSVVDTIKHVCMEMFGYSPNLHIDCLSKEIEETCDEVFKNNHGIQIFFRTGELNNTISRIDVEGNTIESFDIDGMEFMIYIQDNGIDLKGITSKIFNDLKQFQVPKLDLCA